MRILFPLQVSFRTVNQVGWDHGLDLWEFAAELHYWHKNRKKKLIPVMFFIKP